MPGAKARWLQREEECACFKGPRFIRFVVIAALFPGARAIADDRETCATASGEGASAACTRIIETKKYSGRYLAAVSMARGVEFINRNDYDHATLDFVRAIQLAPKNAAAFYNRGLEAQSKGNLDYAIADYDHAIRLNPKDVVAFSNRGLAYQQKGEYRRATADYDHAIRLDPTYAVAFCNRGNACTSWLRQAEPIRGHHWQDHRGSWLGPNAHGAGC